MNFTSSKSFASRVKASVISIHNHTFSPTIEKLCLFLEYSQLLALTVIFTSYTTGNESPSFPFSILSFSKVFCPGYFIQFNENNESKVLIWFFIIFVFFIVKYMYIIYTLFVVTRGEKSPDAFSKLWSWIFLSQGRILFLFVGSFCANIFQGAMNTKDIPTASTAWTYTIAVMCIGMIVLEFAFSFALELNFSCCLPTKRFLSSKTPQSELITLIQKATILLMMSFLPSASFASNWILVITDFLFNVSRDSLYYRPLPPYKLQTIYYKWALSLSVTCSSLCCIVRAIADSVYDGDINANFMAITWVILTLLALKLTKSLISKKIMDLCLNSSALWSYPPEIMMQKIEIIKQIKKQQEQKTVNTIDSEGFYVLLSTVKKNIQLIFSFNPLQITSNGNETFNIDDKISINRLFASYLEQIVAKHPHCQLARLYLAYYYGIKLKMYGSALKVLRDIEQSCSFNMFFNISLLRHRIQDYIKKKEQTENRPLDLYSFAYNTRIVESMKQKMIAQADLQINLYQEHSQQNPDLVKILNYSQSIEVYRKSMSKKIEQTIENIPDYFVEPLLVSAYYHHRLNFSVSESFKAYKAFSRKYAKYELTFKADKLCEENLYDKNKVFFIIKTHIESLGTIASCSKSANEVLGWRNNELNGRNLSSFMPPVLANWFYERIRNYMQTERESSFRGIERSFSQNKDGFLIPVDYYLGLHPVITKELHLDLILRPVPSSTDYLIVDRNGSIQASTEAIWKKLYLKRYEGDVSKSLSLRMNISSLSNELGNLNKACDLVASLKYAELSQNDNLDAEKLLDFDFQEQTLVLKPAQTMNFSEDNKPYYMYHCKVRMELYRSTYIKIFSFDQIEEADSLRKTKKDKGLYEETKLLQSDISLTCLDEGQSAQKFNAPFIKAKTSSEEKEAGWIDLGRLNSEYRELYASDQMKTSEKKDTLDRNLTKESELFAPELIDSAKALLIPSPNVISTQKLQDPSKKRRSTYLDKAQDLHKADRKNDIVKATPSLGESYFSSSSQQQQEEMVFTTALDIKYYPRIYKLCIPSLYGLLLAILVLQINIQLDTNHAIQRTIGRRSILQNAEVINQFIARLHRNSRQFVGLSQGVLPQSGLARSGLTVQSLQGYLLGNFNGVLKASLKAFSMTDSISNKDRGEIFANNILLYEADSNEVVETLNVFQTTIRIYEAGTSALTMAKTNITTAIPQFKFILRNAVNNLLVATWGTSELFFSISQKEINTTEELAQDGLILMCLATLLVGICLVYLVSKQYGSEKRNLNSFVSIKRESVQIILMRLVDFKSTLQEGGSFEYTWPIDSVIKSNQFAKHKLDSFSKSEASEGPNVRGLLRKNISLFLRASGILLIMATLFIVGYVRNKDAFSYIHTKLAQGFFVGRMITHINLGLTAGIELYVENNTTLVMNKPASVAFEEILSAIGSINTEAYQMFPKTNSIYDQTIQTILYGDGCSVLTNPVAFARCDAGQKGRTDVGLVNLIADFEAGLANANDQYKQSNKSAEYLRNMLPDFLTTTDIPSRAITELGNYTLFTLDQDFAATIADITKEKDALDIVIEVVIVLSGIVLWIYVLKRLVEAENKFKKVLKTLPKDLIMSNFILKAYLLKTSKRTLN